MSAISLPRFARLLLASLGVLLGLSAPLRAQLLTTDQINQQVWARVYGVSAAQLGNAAWLAADDDGDGQTNGQEVAAGTNPFSAGSAVKITSVVTNATFNTSLDLTFPTQSGKQYVLQSKAALTDASWTTSASILINGTGTAKTLTVPKSTGNFFRVLVQDMHSDSDTTGVGDWAKLILGLDTKNKYSNKQTDAFGASLDDRAYVSSNLASGTENLVTITTRLADSTATQPDSGNAATDSGLITISRGGLASLLKAITVNLVTSGTAVSSQDYAGPLPATVTFAAGQTTQTVLVTPITPPSPRLASMTVTATLAAGTGYTIPSGNGKTATVVIYPSPTPSGTGLLGKYHNTSSSNYSTTQQTIFNGTAEMSRTDATVDFANGVNGWGSTAGPSGMSPVSATGAFSVRWTGQVQPQYSELYTFFVNSDDGAVLTVNGQTVINQWTAHTLAEYNGSIALVAGVKYDIQLEYFNSTGNAEAHLSWMSPNQSKVIIPQNRLYPTSGVSSAPPAISSASVAYGYVNQTFGFTVTASNLASPIPANTFALIGGNLPLGLSLNTQSGAISGSPSLAGDYQIVVSVTKAGVGTAVSALDIQILDTGSGFTREVWQNIAPTTNIYDIPVTTTPNISDTVTATALEDNAANYGTNYGERLSGFITPPTSGNYYFWISANDSAELWISNDSEPANKVKRASVSGGAAALRQWTATTGQKSPWVALVGGQKYYVEILHKALSGASNHVSVAWYQDPLGNSGSGYTGAPVLPSFITTGSGVPKPAATGGVVPGYATWKYFKTPTSSAPGTLYSATMLPEVNGSTGSGTASLRVSADGTSAVLAFTYTLTGVKTGEHIHTDTYKRSDGTIVPGQILFDIDTGIKLPDGSYVWDLTQPPANVTTADMLEILREGKAYINIHSGIAPNGEILGYFALTNGSPTFTPPPNPPALAGNESSTDAGASRFLAQATFGPTAPDIALVKTNGFQIWLTNQFATPASHLSPDVVRQTLNVPFNSTMTWNAWWKQSVTAPDQLRQRMAFALSQILVISDVGPLYLNARTQCSYYDLLLDDAFTNFRTILKDVTLHPAMGKYLDMVSNDKADNTTGLHSNENYGREINQLFSIGLYRMWPDGSVVTDSKGNPVPTYTQDVITGFSNALNGWSYDQADSGGRLPLNFTNSSLADTSTTFTAPMKLTRYHHELGSKLLLDNVMIPPTSGYPQMNAGYMNSTGGYLLGSVTANSPADITTALTVSSGTYAGKNLYDANGLIDLDTAIDNIFNNQSTGPFICRQLIQRLVTSSPSPGYLYRVVQAFNGEKNSDGIRTNVRGDMKDVIKAILLDYEARSTDMLVAANFPTYGKQREPLLRVTAPARYFLPQTSVLNGTYSQTSGYVTDFGSTVPRPLNRIKVSTTAPHRLVNGDTIKLDFSSNGLTVGTLPLDNNYTVRTSDTSNFTVETKELAQGNYSWSGTTLTINTNSLSGSANYGLGIGNSLYLTFMPATLGGPTPTSGEYTVTAVDDVNNNLTVLNSPGGVAGANASNPGATITGTQASGPFFVTSRLTSGVSYQIIANNSTVKVNSWQIPHGLVTGDYVFLDGSTVISGSAGAGRLQVTVTDANNFTVTLSPIPTAGTTTTGLVIYALKAPELDRSGSDSALPSVGTKFSTWQMNQTDSESTTASIGQTPLRAATVFNYFFPSYQFPGSLASAGVTTPEFQLTSDSGTMLLTNAIEQGILTSGNTNGLSSFKNSGGAIMMDFSQTLPVGVEQAGVNLMTGLTSTANLPALFDVLNHQLAGGTLSAATKSSIVNFVSNSTYFPYTTPTLTQQRDRIRAMVHLIVTCPEHSIQK